MASKIYTVTVATGSSYGGGTGNVYFLDGVRNATGPGTVDWVAGATIRFDQSNGTNDNHPLVFSTNTSTSGIISANVTYYLDGSSNQSNYTNKTTFNNGTTRYIEIPPQRQTDFYYLQHIFQDVLKILNQLLDRIMLLKFLLFVQNQNLANYVS